MVMSNMACHMCESVKDLACQVCAAVGLEPLHHVPLIGAEVPASLAEAEQDSDTAS